MVNDSSLTFHSPSSDFSFPDTKFSILGHKTPDIDETESSTTSDLNNPSQNGAAKDPEVQAQDVAKPKSFPSLAFFLALCLLSSNF